MHRLGSVIVRPALCVRSYGGNMKHIIISADGDSMVYLVPDEVADQLDKYCLSFCDTWLHTSPDAEPYRTGSIVSYDEKDFIKYLNT